MKRTASAIVFVVVPVYLLLSLAVLLFVPGRSYEALLGWYGGAFPGAFSVAELREYCMTRGWYDGVCRYQVFGIVGIGVLLLMYLLLYRRVWRGCRLLMDEAGWWFGIIRHTLRAMDRGDRLRFILLLGLILVYRLYFFFAFPLHTDELCSYLYFARPGWLVAVTSYPIPNNHVLFNAFCAIWAWAPMFSPKLVMRMPGMLGDLCLWAAIYCLVRRWSDPRRAWVVVAGTAFCYLSSYFAVQGRGYEWQVICAMGSGLAGWSYVRGSDRRGGALFVAFNAAGLYLNPTFLYHFLAVSMMGSWLLRQERVRLLRFWSLLGLTAALVMVLYLPLILASGWVALTGNGYLGGRMSFEQLAGHFDEFTFILKDMSYYGRVGMWLILGLLVAGSVMYKRGLLRRDGFRLIYLYWAGLLLAMVLVTLYQRIYPVERALVYLGVSMNLVFLYFIYELAERYWPGQSGLLIAGLLVVKLGGSLRGLYWPRWSVEERMEVKVTRRVEADVQTLAGLRPRTWQIMSSDDYYPMYMRRWLAEHGGGAVIFEREKLVGDVVFVPAKWRGAVKEDGRYRVWASDRLTEFGMPLYIYVSAELADRMR